MDAKVVDILAQELESRVPLPLEINPVFGFCYVTSEFFVQDILRNSI